MKKYAARTLYVIVNLFLSFYACSASAVSGYTVTDLTTLTGFNISATSINNAGDFAGSYYSSNGSTYRAFIYSGGTLTDIGTLNGDNESYVFAMNDARQATGYSSPSYGAYFYSNQTMSGLGTFGGSWSTGLGMNNAGQVVGDAYLSSNAGSHAFLYSNGVMSDLGTLIPGQGSSTAVAINSSGQIVGHSDVGNTVRAFLYENGAMTEIGALGGLASNAADINDLGHIVGNYYPFGDSVSHAFLFENGSIIDLGTLGGDYSAASRINIHGQIIGSSTITTGADQVPFVYLDGQMYDLNSFLAPGSNISLTNALDINDAGQIVAYGTTVGPRGLLQGHAFLMTPVPIPGALGLMLAGIGMFAPFLVSSKRKSC